MKATSSIKLQMEQASNSKSVMFVDTNKGHCYVHFTARQWIGNIFALKIDLEEETSETLFLRLSCPSFMHNNVTVNGTKRFGDCVFIIDQTERGWRSFGQINALYSSGKDMMELAIYNASGSLIPFKRINFILSMEKV